MLYQRQGIFLWVSAFITDSMCGKSYPEDLFGPPCGFIIYNSSFICGMCIMVPFPLPIPSSSLHFSITLLTLKKSMKENKRENKGALENSIRRLSFLLKYVFFFDAMANDNKIAYILITRIKSRPERFSTI